MDDEVVSHQAAVIKLCHFSVVSEAAKVGESEVTLLVVLHQGDRQLLQQPEERRHEVEQWDLVLYLLPNDRETIDVVLSDVNQVGVSADHGRQEVVELEHHLPLDGSELRVREQVDLGLQCTLHIAGSPYLGFSPHQSRALRTQRPSRHRK